MLLVGSVGFSHLRIKHGVKQLAVGRCRNQTEPFRRERNALIACHQGFFSSGTCDLHQCVRFIINKQMWLKWICHNRAPWGRKDCWVLDLPLCRFYTVKISQLIVRWSLNLWKKSPAVVEEVWQINRITLIVSSCMRFGLNTFNRVPAFQNKGVD